MSKCWKEVRVVKRIEFKVHWDYYSGAGDIVGAGL
jgi:hypothetical protein